MGTGSEKHAKAIVPGKMGHPDVTTCRQLHPSFSQPLKETVGTVLSYMI